MQHTRHKRRHPSVEKGRILSPGGQSSLECKAAPALPQAPTSTMATSSGWSQRSRLAAPAATGCLADTGKCSPWSRLAQAARRQDGTKRSVRADASRQARTIGKEGPVTSGTTARRSSGTRRSVAICERGSTRSTSTSTGSPERTPSTSLTTFPIVRREDEAEFGSYRTRDLILAYMNALAAGDTETSCRCRPWRPACAYVGLRASARMALSSWW